MVVVPKRCTKLGKPKKDLVELLRVEPGVGGLVDESVARSAAREEVLERAPAVNAHE